MSYPADLALITVTNRYTKASNGAPDSGTVTFRNKVTLVNSTDGTSVTPLVVVATLDANGDISVVLPASNDPDWSPASFTYHVFEKLSTGTRQYDIVVPYNAVSGAIKLSALAPVPASDGALYALKSDVTGSGGGAVSSVNGRTGPVTGLTETSTLTTKGDLYVATAPGTVARLAVGANNSVLTADSATGPGVKWAAVPADVVQSVNGRTGPVTGLVDTATLTNKGDLYVATGAGAVTRLPVGTDNNVLVASSGAAAGVIWAPELVQSVNGRVNAVTGLVDASTLTAKGDLLGATGAGAVARVPVGANGRLLTADSSAGTGVSWQAPVVAATVPIIRRALINSGDITVAVVNAFIPVPGLELQLPAVVGDTVELFPSFMHNAVDNFFDMAALVFGHPIADTFGTKDLAKWTWFDTAGVSGGQLILIPKTGYSDKIESTTSFNLIGGTATAEAITVPLGNGGIDVYFTLFDGSDELRFTFEGGSMIMREIAGASNTSTSITYDPVAHRFLRFWNDGTTMEWRTSPDNVTYTTRRSITPGKKWGDVKVRFQTGYFGTEPTPGQAVFDNLDVTAQMIARRSSTGTSSGTAAGEGDPALYAAPGTYRTSGALFSFVAGANDLDTGNVRFTILSKGAGGQKIFASTNYPFRWRAINYGAVG